MTNIIQVQNRLKSVPDETLISEIQQPTGQAPSFLVLNELNRRKNDRAEYARLQQEGPQTTVAEDIVRPTAPPVRPPMGQAGPPMRPPMPPPQAMGAPQAMPPQQQMPQQPPMRPQPIQMNEGGLASLPKFQEGGGYNMLEELNSLSQKWRKTPAEIARQRQLKESLASARGGRSELDLPATVGQPSLLSRGLSKAKSLLPNFSNFGLDFNMGSLAKHRAGQLGDLEQNRIRRKIADLAGADMVSGPGSAELMDVARGSLASQPRSNAAVALGNVVPLRESVNSIAPLSSSLVEGRPGNLTAAVSLDTVPSRLDIAGVGGENPPDTFDRASGPGWYGGTFMPDRRQITKPVPSVTNIAGFPGPYDMRTGAVNKDAAAINYASAVLGGKSDVGRYNRDARIPAAQTPFLPIEGGQPSVEVAEGLYGPVNPPSEGAVTRVNPRVPSAAQRKIGGWAENVRKFGFLSPSEQQKKDRLDRLAGLGSVSGLEGGTFDPEAFIASQNIAADAGDADTIAAALEAQTAREFDRRKVLPKTADALSAELEVAQANNPKVVPAAVSSLVASRDASVSQPTKKVVSNGLVVPASLPGGNNVRVTSAAFTEPAASNGNGQVSGEIVSAADRGPNVGPFSVSPIPLPDPVQLQTDALLNEIKKLEADAPTLNADTKITDLQNRATKIDEERGSTAARRLFEAGLNIMAEAGKPGASFGGTIPSILRAVGTGAAPAVSAYGKDVAALEARKDALQSKIVDAQLRGDANAIQQHTNSLKAISDRIGLLQAQQRIGLEGRRVKEAEVSGVAKRAIDKGGLKVRQDTLALHRDTENRLKNQYEQDKKMKVFESLQRTPDATKFRNDYYHALYTAGSKEDQKAGLSNGIRRTSGTRPDGSTAHMYTTEGKAGAKHAKKWKQMGSGSTRAFNELAAGQQRIVRNTRTAITAADKALKADSEFRTTVRKEKVNIADRIKEGKLTVPAGKTKAAFIKEELEKFKRTLPAYANKIGLEADLKNALALSKRYSLQAAGETTDDKADAIPVVRDAKGNLIIKPKKI